MEKLFLKSGEIIVTERDIEIVTVLGSCVSMILFDTRKKISGINHYVNANVINGANPTYNYGLPACEKLVEVMRQRCGGLQNITAKIFGGAMSMEMTDLVSGENIKMAETILKKYHIPVNERNVGGHTGRTVTLTARTGEVKYREAKGSVIDTQASIAKLTEYVNNFHKCFKDIKQS